nr:hypothetical protein [uncultured Desulfobulbus sp.]
MKHKTKKIIIIICYILKTSLSYSFPETGAILEPVDITDFNENIDINPNVSGTRLAGMRYGIYNENINVEELYIPIPLNQNKKVCVSSIIRSGRFNSENIYIIKQINHNAEYAKVSTITINGKDYINKININDFSLKSFQSDACDCCEKNAIYYPLMYKKIRTENFIVNVNSSGMNTSSYIEIKHESNIDKINGKCAYSKDESNITFDTTCNYIIHSKYYNSNAILYIILNDGFEKNITTYNIKL